MKDQMKKIKNVTDLPRYQRFFALQFVPYKRQTAEERAFMQETVTKDFSQWLEEWNKEVEIYNQENVDGN